MRLALLRETTGFKVERHHARRCSSTTTSAIWGAIIALIGTRPVSDTLLQTAHASVFYQVIGLVIVGSGLVLAGPIVIGIGWLKAE